METDRTIQIANGIYWVGGNDQNGGLHCNPYLIIDGEEAVFIDPGSVLDFDYVYQNVLSLIPLKMIKYVILQHQDPDLCSSVPLFEKEGAQFQIVTHWRTAELVKFYGIKSDYYIVNENEFKLELKSGRTLGFVPTPYLHFPGAITTYDVNTKILFSSDLFGAFSYEWNLYAGDDYMEKMKTFHEHYMPSNDIIRPVMEGFLSMDITMIAPQHGSIINNNIPDYIKTLRDLDCGAFLTPIKKDMAKSGGYRFVCSSIIKRYASIFKKEDVVDALGELDISLDQETMEIVDYNYRGPLFWNLLFENIYTKQGVQWLIVIEPFVQTLCKEYDLLIPEVFQNTLIKSQEEVLNLNKENTMLKEINSRLNNSMIEAQEKLIKCPVTGLYNYNFFKNYISNNIRDLIAENSQQNPALIIINADNMAKIKFSYGDDEVDGVLKNMVYTMKNIPEENVMFFRLQGASFSCYIPHTTREIAVDFAEKLRNNINSSEKFIEKITVSMGVVCFEEVWKKEIEITDPAELMYDIAIKRVNLAKKMGMNMVCSHSSVEENQDEIGKILIVDTDEINIDVLKTFLENLKYKVFTARDGEEALNLCEKEVPALIISEVMLPKLDAFQVRQKLLSQSITKHIPFVIVSHLKNDDSVQRAAALEVEHYLKKPYMLSELIGIIRNKVKEDASS